MIKLFSLKQQKKDEEGSSRAGGSQKKASAAQLRITKGKKISQPPTPNIFKYVSKSLLVIQKSFFFVEINFPY